MSRDVNDIIGLSEKYFVRIHRKRVTFFRADRRFKAADVEKGKLVYANKWVSTKDFKGMQTRLVKPADITASHRGKELPKGIRKVHFKPTKLQYSYKLDSTRKKHKTTYIAYTKDHVEQFKAAIKKKRVPIQRKEGQPASVVDLKQRTRAQKIIKEWKEDVSP